MAPLKQVADVSLPARIRILLVSLSSSGAKPFLLVFLAM